MNWLYLTLGVLAYPFIRLLIRGINHTIVEYRHKRFLKLVNIEFPDHTDITFISIDTSDKRSMDRLERQLRERYEILEEPVDSSRENHGV
jgi:hypothetical protein